MGEFSINGRMAVKTLKKQFLEEFGAGIRVYDGKKFADDNATLASIRTGDTKGGDLKCAGNMQVGNFETKIKELFGIIVQVVDKEDKRLIDNSMTLSKASEVIVKSRKADETDINNESSENEMFKAEVRAQCYYEDGCMDMKYIEMMVDEQTFNIAQTEKGRTKTLKAWTEKLFPGNKEVILCGIEKDEDYWNSNNPE